MQSQFPVGSFFCRVGKDGNNFIRTGELIEGGAVIRPTAKVHAIRVVPLLVAMPKTMSSSVLYESDKPLTKTKEYQ